MGEEAMLLRVLARIKKEKEEEMKKNEADEKKSSQSSVQQEVLRGNPLLNKSTFSVKRRWDEDVVFTNQSRSEPKKTKKFINDSIRSEFHKNFLKKYVW